MLDIRLYISKTGNMKYVSHLDMFRLMQRAVRRADIPLWYTEGFNPHPYISFLQALPLGVESEREPCDIKITEEISPDEIKNRLNAVMPGNFRIVNAVVPFNKPAEIRYSGFEFVFTPDVITADELEKALSSGALTCEKQGKSGRQKIMREINVSEHIPTFKTETDENGETRLNVTVSAGTAFNLSPGNLLDALSRFTGREIKADRIKRTGFLCENFAAFE